MVIKCVHMVMAIGVMIIIIDGIHIAIYMIKTQESTIETTNGINVTVGVSKKEISPLNLIQILTFKVRIMITTDIIGVPMITGIE